MTRRDVPEVARLLGSSIEERLHPYIVYSQPRIDSYLTVMVDWPRMFPGLELYVARDGDGGLTGFAELRSTGPATCLLSYVCVAPAARRTGVATRLLLHHLVEHPELDTVELDVFAHNAPAGRLYERLGFVPVRTSFWRTRDLPDPAPAAAGEVVLPDWHMSAAMLATYGFCRFSVQRGGHPHALGLVSSAVLRVADRAAFADDRLLALVRHLLPETRQALLIDQAAGDPPPPSALLLESRRLHAAATTVRANAR
jgi:RimJ/RimL family protein N-acetyltransferase